MTTPLIRRATADDMRLDRYENRSHWQRMAHQLLNAYAERFYRYIRGRWEAPYLEVAELAPDDPNLVDGYSIETTDLAQTSEQIEQIATFIEGLKTAIGENALATWSQWGGRWRTVPFGGHLYQPLLHVGKNAEIRISPVALDTRRLVIELDRDIDFNAGQYLKFPVPGTDVDRTYSIASAPTEKRRLEFHIRRVPGGAATDGWIFAGLAVGDQIPVSGPYGRFVLHVGRDNAAIMVAGGTGLAPIKSMVRHALDNDAYDGHITLYQGARTRAWLYDVEEFQALAKEHPDRFTYRPCLSEETLEDAGDGYAYGMVTDVIAADHESLSGAVGYLCGPPAMVEAALKTLMSRRLFPRDIYREEFLNESDKASGVKSPLIKR